jgi:hypothetical protein
MSARAPIRQGHPTTEGYFAGEFEIRDREEERREAAAELLLERADEVLVAAGLVLGHFEDKRQARIAAGLEHACTVCGCSESRACPGGCVWATERLCSRCA